jgi:hypothetical protein
MVFPENGDGGIRTAGTIWMEPLLRVGRLDATVFNPIALAKFGAVCLFILVRQ